MVRTFLFVHNFSNVDYHMRKLKIQIFYMLNDANFATIWIKWTFIFWISATGSRFSSMEHHLMNAILFYFFCNLFATQWPLFRIALSGGAFTFFFLFSKWLVNPKIMSESTKIVPRSIRLGSGLPPPEEPGEFGKAMPGWKCHLQLYPTRPIASLAPSKPKGVWVP